jgi:hypothetical protein
VGAGVPEVGVKGGSLAGDGSELKRMERIKAKIERIKTRLY